MKRSGRGARRRPRWVAGLGLALALAVGPGASASVPRVSVAVPDEIAALPGFEAGLAPYAWIARVPDGSAAALRATAGPAGFAIVGEDGAPAAAPVPASAPDAGARLAERVVRVAHRRVIAGLENPASALEVAFRLERAEGGPADAPLERVEPGAELRWEAHNASSRPLYVTVFAVSADRGVTLVHPYRGRPKPLDPGDRVDQTGTVDLPEGARTARDRLQLVATPRRIDPARFLDPSTLAGALAELEAGDWTGAHHEIRVRREVVEIVEDAPQPIVSPGASGEPAVREAAPRRRPPRVLRFGVHFAGPMELGAVEARTAKLRTLCGRGGMACRIRRLFAQGSVFELERRGRRLGEGASQTVASAWEQAYEIRDGLEAARVEPFLELEMPFGAEAEATRGAGPAPDDRAHLDRVRASQAWAALRRAGRPRGREAEGVVVGLADTGWRPHPEIAAAVGGPPPVRESAGWDFVDDDADARDPLATRTPAGLAAHGTGSASLLASPPGCQLAGQAGCAEGLAPGVAVAPLRVHRSPAHHDAGRLAGVLDAVASSSGGGTASGALAEPVPILAIAMAGPPGWTLWQAAARAERAGRLLVASAGSSGGTVLWPARFDSTVAVAALGVSCGLWPHSGRGAAVDVAAPGEAVWRAGVSDEGLDVNAPGASTGFATALVAGAGALWLARWDGDARLAAARSRGGVTAAFRHALARTARRPGAAGCGEGGASAGPGELDAAALVARAPSASASPSAPVALRDLPLFRSLYARGDRARAASDYARLFARPSGAPLEPVAHLEGELLHHYAMTDEVTRAIDAARAAAPGAGDWGAARRALLRQGLSRELREALRAAEE